jgi:hypothetical protein
MTRTSPDVLDRLLRGGVLPTYWRRKRATAKWHRGFRLGTQIVHSSCDKIAGLHKGNLLLAPITEPWPEPHCGGCERGTPGSDAVREFVYEGVTDPYAPVLGRVRRRGRRA